MAPSNVPSKIVKKRIERPKKQKQSKKGKALQNCQAVDEFPTVNGFKSSVWQKGYRIPEPKEQVSDSFDRAHDYANYTEEWLCNEAGSVLPFDSVKLGTRSLTLDFVRSGKEMKYSDFQACFRIVQDTSRNDYLRSSVGWCANDKRWEMLDDNMLYVLVRQGPTRELPQAEKEEREARAVHGYTPDPRNEGLVLGFISFMFARDDPPNQAKQVVYMYEIHLAEHLRRIGLGRHLIGIAEAAGRRLNISKCMLTVFNANQQAIDAYNALGYTKDPSSPRGRTLRGKHKPADYQIMSRAIMAYNPFLQGKPREG